MSDGDEALALLRRIEEKVDRLAGDMQEVKERLERLEHQMRGATGMLAYACGKGIKPASKSDDDS